MVDQGHTIIDRFERDHPETATALRDLRELTDLMDECLSHEYHDPPPTYSANSTDGEYIVDRAEWYAPDPAARWQPVATDDTTALQATAEQRQTDAACLAE